MEGIQLSVEKVGSKNSISIIKVGGYIDTTTSSELEHALNSLLKAGSYNIVIDLGNVDYVSSAGWGIFISEIKGIREKGGDLKLVRMIPEVYEVFELLEFHYILKAFDTLEEAVRDFERTSPAAFHEPEVLELDANLKVQKGSLKKEPTEERVVDPTLGPTIEESLKKIVAKFPDANSSQIIRILNTPEYGNYKVGWFGLRKLLKTLNLDSKKKKIELAKNYKG